MKTNQFHITVVAKNYGKHVYSMHEDYKTLKGCLNFIKMRQHLDSPLLSHEWVISEKVDSQWQIHSHSANAFQE